MTHRGVWKAGVEDLVSAVLRATAQPIWVVDADGLITFANPAAIEALGYDSADELFGRNSHETIHYRHPDGRPYPASECPMLLPRATGETVTSELDWFFRRDGSMFPVSYVSVPIEMSGGRGAVVAFTDIETRLDAEQSLRDREAGLAEQQAALRRVAALVASDAPSSDVFAAIAREVGGVLKLPLVQLSRYEPDGTATVIGAWSARPHPFQAGTNWPLDGATITSRVRETGRPARIDDLDGVPGVLAEAVRRSGIRCAAGAPIVVSGRVWGVMTGGSTEHVPLPADIDQRLAEFTELVATAVANAQAREDVQRLAQEQAALRRVATLVAQGAPPEDVFSLVAQEIAGVTGLEMVMVGRYDPDRTVLLTGAAGDHPFQPGTRWPLDGRSVSSQVLETGRPVTSDPYAKMTGTIADAARSAGFRAGVGAPIIVDGRVWGNVSVGGTDRAPLPPDIERRLAQLTELVATAVSNAQGQQNLRRLAHEQTALRRIATLVARGADSQDVFAAVCEETGRLFGATTVNLVHFTPDGLHVAMSGWSMRGVHVPTATTLPLDGETIDMIVLRTGAPGRCDSYEGVSGELAALIRRLGIRSEVGAPVVLDGSVWGALIAGTDEPEPLAAGTEHRLAGFAELIATAVSNATVRGELVASRARIATAADEQRRRVVRDLHDGAQQRLVHAAITLQLANAEAQDDASPEDTRAAIEELRELAHGIHPALLTSRGLAAAVEALADRAPLPVHVDIPDARYPAIAESAAYFIAAEALTNVAKYAEAGAARVTARRSADSLVIEVQDDGVGGADPSKGSGLSGLQDRVAALDGTLTVESPPGEGTRICAELPLPPATA
ncbi:MAG: GAF domain-containing protein [Solirubrobacteraceae bacterium]